MDVAGIPWAPAMPISPQFFLSSTIEFWQRYPQIKCWSEPYLPLVFVGGMCHSLRMESTTLAPASRLPASFSDAELTDALASAFQARRDVDAQLLALSGEVAERSRNSLGPAGLASRSGCTNAPALVAEIGRITTAEAAKLCRMGAAISPRLGLTGEWMPPLFPHVANALASGSLSLESASVIVATLTTASPRAEVQLLDTAERCLVEFAGEHPTDPVRKLAIHWRDALDPDGIEPREAEMVERRSLKRFLLANGMKRYVLELDPLSAGFLDAAIDASVGKAIRRPQFVDSEGRPADASDADGAGGFGSDGGADVPGGECCVTDEPSPATIAQLGADALVDLARHAAACTAKDVPLPSATIVVRMTLESLLSGLGIATIDGAEQPISAGTARRLAADAHIIPEVLGGASEVLDLGMSRRLFTKAQRIAFAERDGGCAWGDCGRPPSHTEAHHIRWWSHDEPTNLDNGILLCSKHHHALHRDGWQITIRDNVPWFVPPSSVDVQRRPRRGGRVRRAEELQVA